MGRANITVNKNAVPNDPRSPFVTSGLRIGSPAITRRGFKEKECLQLVDWMSNILTDINDEAAIERVKKEVLALCANFQFTVLIGRWLVRVPILFAANTKVIDSRLVTEGNAVRRRRECQVCQERFTL